MEAVFLKLGTTNVHYKRSARLCNWRIFRFVGRTSSGNTTGYSKILALDKVQPASFYYTNPIKNVPDRTETFFRISNRVLESHIAFKTIWQTLYSWIPSVFQRETRNEETSAACDQVCWPSRTQSHGATWLESLLCHVPRQDVYNNAGACLELRAWRQMIWIVLRSQSVQRQPLGEKASGHSGLWRQFQRHFRGEFRCTSRIPR